MKFRKKTDRRRQATTYNQPRVSANNYYRSASRPVMDSTRAAAKLTQTNEEKRRFQFRKSPTTVFNGLIAVSIVLIMLAATTLSGSVALQLETTAYSYRPATDYHTAARELMAATLGRKSKLFFRSTSYERELAEKYPELSAVDAVVPLGGRTLSLFLQVEPPLARLQSGSDKGLITKDGTMVANTTSGSELPLLRFATPQENFTNGSQVLTSREVQLVRLIRDEFAIIRIADKPLVIKEVLFSILDGQMSVSFTDAPYVIKYSIYAEPEQQVGGSIATLKQLSAENALPAEYIDVRVPGRVFVL